MNDDASSSKPPPPLPSELLAPGFRFHPTDEELVSYYLKRRVSGRPLRVDAIAEVELYKAEPWDLPAMSRLQSRDMEWYFFSPLDRKYANRSRTNRATVQGYWKTTGKDRAIRRGPRIVGMKKTLVFHVGRAPRGERTNWVMHEYRLEDEELDRAGISQDAYVVCRIFQKSGSGPQNGAQYGGAFIEEEWEEADDLVPAIEGGGNAVTSSWDEEYLQLADFVHNEDQGNEPGSNGLLTASSDEQNSGSQLEDPFLLETFQDQSFVDMNSNGLQDSPNIYNDMEGDIGLAIPSHSPPSQNDGYVELNDLIDAMNQGDESNNLPETYEVEEFFDTFNESSDEALFQVLLPTVQDDFVLEPDNLLNPMAGDYPSEQTTAEDNMVFFDAPSNDQPFAQDNFVQMNDLLYSPTADPSGFSLLDDIMVYFDSTDTNLHYSTLDYSSENLQPVDSSVLNQSNFAPEVDNSSVPPEANPGWDASSSSRLPNADDRPNNINEDIMVAPDSSKEKGCDQTVKNRLVNMLGSISAPPAFAAEFPAASGKSTSNSASSVHVTTGMIKIHGFKEMGMAEHWSLHKNRSSGHGFASDYAVDGYEPITKERGWTISAVLQDGFNLFFRTAVFAAVCFKVVMCVYSR